VKREGQTGVGRAARALLGRLDRGGNMERAEAVSAWKQAAGEDVSSHAMGFTMRGDELVVYVDSSVWASELSSLSEQYRTAVNDVLGRDLVGRLRFTVSKKVSEQKAWAEARRQERDAARPEQVQPVPLDEGERLALEETAAAIHDPELREAALRAAIRDLEWKKGLRSRKEP
jgi:hypothetical protein